MTRWSLALQLALVICIPAAQAQLCYEAAPVGWAAVNGLGNNGTTGGAGGTEVTVSTFADLEDYANRGGAYIIYVQGTIVQPGGDPIRIEDNNGNGNDSGHKTIIGLGSTAVIQGEVRIRKGAKNIIIRNIKFDGNNGIGDGVSISGESVSGSGPVHHIWVDHCDFTRYTDGPLDITHGADYITASWNHFYNTNRVSLVGHSDTNGSEDSGHLTVTYHHNWFDHTIQRHPRVRFSLLVHIFNNYYDMDGSALYGTVSTEGASLLLENNYFEDLGIPFKSTSGHDSSGPGFLEARGDIFINCGPTREENNPGGNTVPEASTFYSYTLEAAADVPSRVMTCSGIGVIPTGSDTTPPTPDPLTWASPPAATGSTSIAMTATTASDPSGVQYYFTNQTIGGHDSGWIAGTMYTDTGLSPNTQYTYTVKARDQSAAMNETQPAPALAATTLAGDPETANASHWQFY